MGERRFDDHLAAQAWFSRVYAILETMPWWWRLLPISQRMRREARLLHQHGLFDARAYLARNPDVAQNGMDPLRHYILHGMAEGRPLTAVETPTNTPQPNDGSLFRAGGHRYVPGLGTLLIANHDSSRTGAPLVGLNLARSLLDRWNVFAFVGREEALVEEFRENSTGLIVGWRSEAEMGAIIREMKRVYGLSAIVVNSVEASGFVHAAARSGVAVVALIHEFADYTAPFGRTADAVRLADRVVVPAALVERSLQTEVEFVCGAQAPNIVVRRQGLLPFLPETEGELQSMSRDDIQAFVAERSAGHRHIVLGAGYIGQRKGVDLFVQTAAEVARQRNDIAFLWVGDGYAPRTDMHYSIWVEQMIQRMALEKLVHFLPGQKNLDAAFEVCDLFYLPSRLDPFPNVVIDAFNAGRAVVCFEGATGCAELFTGEGALPGAAVPYCDIAAAAQTIISMIDARTVARDDVPDAPAPDARQLFDFDTYVADIECEIEHAQASAAATDAATRRIVQASAMDAVFYEGRRVTDILGATRDYVASSRKGLARRNPRPGFSDNLWHDTGNASGRCALDEALEVQAGTGEPPRTHVCHRVGSGNLTMPNSGRVALHVHFHYADLAAEFTRRLNASRAELDVFATVTSQDGFRQAEYALMSYRGGTVHTLLVPNRGRDVGPLLVDLADKLDGYDIIGHLHAKRSLVIGRAAGDQWRDFLLDTLLGDHNGVLADILRLFTNDPNLGLVFPEDPHNVGWTANRAFAEQLAQRMHPAPILPQRPIFPIGTMFWARSVVLQPFWNLHLSHDDLPVEPLAYDGTILHSIERLFPAVCQAQNLAWATAYNPNAKR